MKSSIKFTAPVITKDEEVHEANEIKSQEELTSTTVAISIADVQGNDEANGKDIAALQPVVTQAEPEPEKVFDIWLLYTSGDLKYVTARSVLG